MNYNLIKEIDTMIDVGAFGSNIETEAKAVHQMLPNIRIFGFEPAKNRYDELKKDYPGDLINIAIGDKDEITFMCEDFYPRLPPGACGFKTENNGIKFTIQQRSLDSLDKEFLFGDAIFIWCDIEGYELKLLQGCDLLFSSKRIKYVYTELWTASPIKEIIEWPTDVQIKEYLHKRGLYPILVENKGKNKVCSFKNGNVIYLNEEVVKYDCLFERQL